MATVALERRTLLLLALAVTAIAAPVVHVESHVADGVGRAVEAAGGHCAVARASDGVRIDVSALQGAELACRELQRTSEGERWDLISNRGSAAAACTLERHGGSAISAVARVRGADAPAVCAALRQDGWRVR